MKIPYKLLTVVSIASVSLSSCSRANYAFNNATPAYLSSEQVLTSTPVTSTVADIDAATVTATASTEDVSPVAEATSAHLAASALAYPVAKAHATVKAEAAAISESEKVQVTKLDRKAMRQEVKRQLAAAPKGTTAEGKSQVVAAVLCFFLGGLGVHDFYLGRVGKGILQIFLSLILVGVILVIIDFIRILIGTEKPKGGEYAKKI
jgi:TM2 domain-containing membrane protein YozV